MCPSSVAPTRWLPALAVLGQDHAPVRRDRDVVRAVGLAVLVVRGVREPSFSVIVLRQRVENHTWPSCWTALPSAVRANEATKYAPPSPHQAPSSLRLRVMSLPGVGPCRAVPGPVELAADLAASASLSAPAWRHPLDGVRRARLGRDTEVRRRTRPTRCAPASHRRRPRRERACAASPCPAAAPSPAGSTGRRGRAGWWSPRSRRCGRCPGRRPGPRARSGRARGSAAGRGWRPGRTGRPRRRSRAAGGADRVGPVRSPHRSARCARASCRRRSSCWCPARLTYSRTRWLCLSTTMVVVPPWTPGS